MFIAAVIVWCASGLSDPSDIALAINRRYRFSAGSTCSTGNGAAAARTSSRSRSTVGSFSVAWRGERRQACCRIRRRRRACLRRSGNRLQQTHRLRLPSMRLRLIRLAEANPAVIGQIFRRRAPSPAGRRCHPASAAFSAPASPLCAPSHISRRLASSSGNPMPPSGAGVPSKQRSTTSWLSPRQSKRCAPR